LPEVRIAETGAKASEIRVIQSIEAVDSKLGIRPFSKRTFLNIETFQMLMPGPITEVEGAFPRRVSPLGTG